MVEPQASRFWQVALKCGLLDEATLRASWDAVPPEKRTHDAIDRRLARQVVNAGKLTLWQAQQLLAGRWQGLKIDRYELRDVIGHGGMGRVYLARDVRLSRLVALKILSRERMNNPRALTRFRREAKVGAQLQHENLVRIYDEGEAHGVRYLVMEFIEGKTIGKLIAENGRLPSASAANLGRQVALGLGHLHLKGLLHRDVNPSNVLVDRDGTAKLTDLGLAIDLEDDEDIVTRDGATVGTFDYISPEQARHSRGVDGRADLYSLGCTLYHMIAGRVPFPTSNLPEKLFAHQGAEPDPLAEVAPGVPEGLAAVVDRLMRKTPQERYPHALDAARALEPFAGGAIPPAQMTPSADPATAGRDEGGSSGATPDGSDPELVLKPATTTTPGSGTASPRAGADFLPKIDFGPEPALSEGRGRAKSKAKPAAPEPRPGAARRPFPRRAVLSALAILAAAGLAAAIALNWKRLPRFRTPSTPTIRPVTPDPAAAAPPPKGDAPPAEIAIRYPDGSEAPQDDFREAVRRLSGGGGVIVLRSDKPIRAGDPKAPLRLEGGQLVIRAADGARPDLRVVLSGQAPWIEVAPQARLTLSGLSVHVTAFTPPDAKPAPDARPATLIAAHGNLVLERCTFRIEGDDRSPRVIDSQGSEMRASGCLFEGFDRPIVLNFFPGCDARFAHCLFVRDAANPLAGWAITAVRKNNPGDRPRKLTLDRCTALGAGLLATEGFAPDAPLSVTVTNSAMRTSALMLTETTAEALPKAILWTGRDNAYALNGPAWVLAAPTGYDGLKGGPVDLDSWAKAMPGDKGGRARPLKFAGPSTTEGHVPEDYAVIVDKDEHPAGADPAKVGPGAKP